MAASIPALVKPELLAWARERSGLSVAAAAKKLHVDEAQVRAWENGSSEITIAKLRKLADAYKRPLEVFFLDEPPMGFTPMRDHRRLPNDQIPAESHELILEVRRAQEAREVALELMSPGSEPFELSASLFADPEAVAIRARDRLEVSTAEQRNWASSHMALREWTRSVESLGVLVLQASGVSVQEMRGASISQHPLPVVLLNGRDTPNGRIFTLMHELTHLMLQDGGICDHSDLDKVEVFCNRVAANILMPRDAVTRHTLFPASSKPRKWSDEDISILADDFHVSREAIVRRLVDLDATDEVFYNRKRAEYLSEYRVLEERRQREGSKARIPQYRKALKRFGTPYVSAVLGALRERRVTLSDASTFLDLRVKHIPRLEDALWRGRP